MNGFLEAALSGIQSYSNSKKLLGIKIRKIQLLLPE